MKRFLIFFIYNLYTIFILFPVDIIELITGKNLKKIFSRNKIFKYLNRYIIAYNSINKHKQELFKIVSEASYKTDICDATNYIDKIEKRKELKVLSEKERKRIKKELYNYLFEDVIPKFKHRIAVL